MLKRFPAFWLDPGDPRGRLLQPLATLFCGVAALRRRRQRAAARPVAVPVVIVGSLFVGGSGKTPLVIWLATEAQALGWRAGVILRGYGGRARSPRRVTADADPAEVGDEAVLIARRTGVPVAVAADRRAALDVLVRDGCDLVIGDDGLQHYRLARHAEIAVLDAAVGLGNGRCLPAGPLRERPERLAEVDLVIGNGGPVAGRGEAYYRLVPGPVQPVSAGKASSAAPVPGDAVHAVAGIGQPRRFFDALAAAGFRVTRHVFADHHRYEKADLPASGPVIMTEKDAVKCTGFDRDDLWFLPVSAEPAPDTAEALRAVLDTAVSRSKGERG